MTSAESTIPAIAVHRPTAARTESSPRMPQLDGVRGLAILLVLIWHYVIVNWSTGNNPAMDSIAASLGLAWSGVDLFFVLSGFLIGGILLDHRDSPSYFRTFYIRRLTRILPLYFAWLAIYVLLFALPFWTASDSLRILFSDPLPLWTYATFTQNFAMVVQNRYGPEWLGISWSLAIEEQFYALIPLVLRLVPYKRLQFLLFLYITCAPLLRAMLVFVPGYNSLVNYMLMPSRADALLLGVLCAYLVRQSSALQFIRNHLRLLYLTLAILFMGACLLTWDFHTGNHFIMPSVGYSWLALLYGNFLLLAVVETRGPVAALTRNRYLRRLGLVAYGVYLMHQAVNILLHWLILGRFPQIQTWLDVLVTLLALCVTLLIAKLSYTYFEKPILDWGHAFRYEAQEAVQTAV